MRYLYFALVIHILASAAPADAPPADTRAAIDRGLRFLVSDSLAWKENHSCISCHHAALPVWAMREAKERGHAVDEPFLAEWTKWVAESGDGKTGMKRPEKAPKALNGKAVWFALALGADPKPDEIAQKGLKLLLQTVKSDQIENGSWSAWLDTRPPIFGDSDIAMTALATLALTPRVVAAEDPGMKALRDKALKWLETAPLEDDLQAASVRLIVGHRTRQPDLAWKALWKQLLARQRPDGGWAQTKDMASDAWATGQALYALAEVGLKPDDVVVQRGQAFLIKTQKADGSWEMTSRPCPPSNKGSPGLIPITGAGAAWGVLGLVHSSVCIPKKSSAPGR